MSRSTDNRQHRSEHGRAGLPVAAVNRVPLPAAHDKAQDRSSPRVRAGFFVVLNSKATRAGLHRSAHLSHSRIARRCPLSGLSDRRADSLSRVRQSATNSISAQARVGVQTVHDASLLNTIADQTPCKITDRLECHSNNLSSVRVSDASTAIGMAFANEQKDTAAGVKSD